MVATADSKSAALKSVKVRVLSRLQNNIMFYVIQENLFKEHHYELLLDIMNRFKFEYDIVKYLPFAEDIYEWYDSADTSKEHVLKVYETTHNNVFCFGAVGMSVAATKRNWKPGSMLNENHDFNIYASKYGLENMLNGDGYIINLTDPIPFDDEHFFSRPTLDSKVFSGTVFSKKQWGDYIKLCNDNDLVKVISEETKVLVSPVKDIQQEIRCWVVGGKVVTASSYKIGSRIVYKNYDDELFFIDFAQKMVDKYKPAEAFVMDICLANDELKIIEINNINSAGFYNCNMVKLIGSLEDYFN